MMIDDDDLPDWEDLSIGEPMNDTYGAVCAMLTEHMVDAERLNRWLLGLMIASLHSCDGLELHLDDALSTVQVMSHADMAIAGFDTMNSLVGIVKQERKAKRGRRSQG
jgi:hypothetical protein